MSCECDVCVYGREVQKHLDQIEDESVRAFFNDMYERMAHERMDRNYYQAIIGGSWPSAREILANYWPELKS